MSRKDFEAIAESIKLSVVQATTVTKNHGDRIQAIHITARNLANVLAANNPRFDRARFLAACGIV